MLKTVKKILLFSILGLTIFSCSLLKKGDKQNSDNDPRIKNFNFNFYFLEANKQKILGNYQEALQNYQMALSVDNKQASVCYEIAGILNMSRDFAGALEYAEKAVELDNTENKYYRILLAFIYQNNNKLKESAEIYKDLMRTDPDDINYYFELSSIYMKIEKSGDAIEVLNLAEKRFGITDLISLEKEKCYHLVGDNKSALQEIIKLNEAFPGNSRYKTVLAESYVNAGDLEAAKKVYDELASVEQSEGIIYFSIADFYQLIGEYDKAFALLQKGFTREDVEMDIKVRMVLSMLENMGNNKYLIDNVGKLLELLTVSYPDNLMVRALNSDFLIFNGDYKAAQKEYDFILKLDKNKYEIWEQALYVDFLLKDLDAMYVRGKEAIELYPNVLELYRYYIVAAYSTKHFVDVAKAVDYASMLAVSDQVLLVEFLSMQADAFNELGQFHQSDSVFDIVLFKDSENISALNNYSYFLAVRGEKLDKALEMSTKLITSVKDEASYLDTHAWVLYKNGNLTEALNYIDQALMIDSENAVFLEHKGDILYKSGKTDEALLFWISAMEKGSGSDKLKEKVQTKKLIE